MRKSKQKRASGEKDDARRCFLGKFTQRARGRECDWMCAMGARPWVSTCGSLHHFKRLRTHLRICSPPRVCLILCRQEAGARCVHACVCLLHVWCRGPRGRAGLTVTELLAGFCSVIGGDKEAVTLLLWLVGLEIFTNNDST